MQGLARTHTLVLLTVNVVAQIDGDVLTAGLSRDHPVGGAAHQSTAGVFRDLGLQRLEDAVAQCHTIVPRRRMAVEGPFHAHHQEKAARMNLEARRATPTTVVGQSHDQSWRRREG